MNSTATAFLLAGLAFIGLAGVAGPAPPDAAPAVQAVPATASWTGPVDVSPAPDNEVFERYCVRCHNDRRMTGNMSLEHFDAEAPEQNAPLAEKIIRKLRAGMMPPPGARKPEPEVVHELVVALEDRIDEAAARDPNPGYRTFQRLNRAEYQAAVRDLLGLEIDVSAYLPLDTKSANFDNIADVQMPSATLIEGYLRAAGQISRIALGDPDAEVGSTVYRIPRIKSQKERVEGAPFGTRGGLSVVHNFPADGKYVFHVMPFNAVEGEVFGRTFGTEQLEISIDGERVALLTIDRWMSESEPTGLNIRTDSIQVQAGPRRVTAAFVRQFEGEVDDLIRPIQHTMADGQIGIGYGVTTQQHLQRLTILGPFEVTGVAETPTRKAVFTCRPTAPDEERPCAESIVARLAARAYRRPPEGGDVSSLMRFYDRGASEGGFEEGVRRALQAILASPHFVFRMEETPGEVVAGDIYEIRDEDMASRLSFFLWGSPPDRQLVELAARGDLSDADELERQARRLLSDPRAGEALATRFAAQWLRLSDLEDIHPDALTYPYFDQSLADAMLRETELLFAHIVREDRPVMELLTADYTFVNERLARHYGFPGVLGPRFRKVTYPSEHRRGLLGHGSILTLTSHADRTSPVLRGKWVMEVLMGTPPPPPPPDVPAFEETGEADEGRFLTVRERLEAHRSNPACRSCHRFIDPIGLALENYDVTGDWRIRDGGNLVDPVGELYDGTPLEGPDDLRAALLSRPEVIYRVFTENLMAYALGRRVEYYDMPTIRKITSEAAENEYRLSSFVMGIVQSPAFLQSRVPAATVDGPDGSSN